MRNVILAKTAGFCFGVRRAVDMAYGLAGKHKVYTYGPIIHNETVVDDLESKGVRVVHSIDEAAGLRGGTMIIRSHGASKNEINLLKQMGFEIVDATCPFVKKIHRIVEDFSGQGYGIVIIGSAAHPEVQAISGWCKEPPVIIESVEEAENFSPDPDKKLCLVSQTTFNYNKFQELVEIINKKSYNITIKNTICNATEERQTEARDIARKVSAMIVIGDKSSSNTRKLYDISKRECQETFLIQDVEGLDLERLKSARSIGITAGASTPNNIIQEVYTSVRAKF